MLVGGVSGQALAVDPAPRVVRVLLVDDHPLWRDVVESRLAEEGEIRVIGSVGTAAEGIALVESGRPDVVLLDGGLPDLDGMEAARRMRAVSAETAVAFLTASTDVAHVATALALGAGGFVGKTCTGREIVHAILAVASGY